MSELPGWSFVARSDEQERFSTALAGAGRESDDAPTSTVVLVEGLGGHGKSWLMERFRKIATGEVQALPARRPRRRAPTVVSLDWEAEGVSLMPRSTGPPLSLVLAKLYAAIAAEVGTGRLARRRFTRAFRDFITALQGTPDFSTVAGNGVGDTSQALAASVSLARTSARALVDTAVPPAGSLIDQGVSILAEVVKEDGAKARLTDRIAAAVRGEETLVRTFASGLRTLSRHRPIVLLLDTCELIGTGVHWIRRASLQTGGDVVWVLAGRFEAASTGGGSDEGLAFRRELPEERVKIIPMLPFDDETVKLLLRTAGAELERDDELAAVNLTRGIPIGVYLVAKMLSGGRPIEEVLAPIDAQGDSTVLVRGLAERYLKHVRTDPALGVDEHRLYGLALLHDDHLDAELLKAIWDEDGSMDMGLEELSRRHDFVLTPTRRLHAEVRETIRGYLLDTARRSDVRAANERACSALMARIDRVAQGASYEDRLANETWREDMVALLWHTFWVDSNDGLALLAELLPAALIARPAFARDAVGVGAFFFSTLTDDQMSELRGCASLLTFGTFVDRWLARRRTAALKASGPLGRLLDDSSPEDLDAAFRLLRVAAADDARLPETLRNASPRNGLVCLLAARHSTDPASRLEHLEQAAQTLPNDLPKDGPHARELVRVATELRGVLRNGDPGEVGTRDRYLRAAIVDSDFSSELDDANSLGNYAIFLTQVPGGDGAAEQTYERAIAADPNHANNLGNLALFVRRVQGDDDRAEKLYERAIAEDPGHANVLGNYAIFLVDARGDHDGADAMFERAIAADPDNAKYLANYAHFVGSVRRDNDRAKEIFERAIAAGPDDPNALSSYAVFLTQKLGDQDRAEEIFERAIAAGPSDPVALGSYAVFLKRVRGDFDQAEQLYERAIAADPGDADNLGNYAVLLGMRPDSDSRGGEMYERAIAADPNHANNLTNYALFLDGQGDRSHATEMYERAIAASPDNAKNLVAYALFLTVRDDASRATEMYERAIAADPNHANYIGNYALFLDGQGDRSHATEMYERAIAADPNHANNLANYALFLDGQGDRSHATEMYERAIAANPDDADTLGSYALLLAQDDRSRAKEIFERAIAADPNHANNLGNYARLLLELHEDVRAFALIEQAFARATVDHDPLRAELWLYLAAVGSDPGRAEALSSIEKLVDAGARSPGWDFSGVLARARENPELPRLETLAARLTAAE